MITLLSLQALSAYECVYLHRHDKRLRKTNEKSSFSGQPYTTEGSESLFHVIKDDIEYIFKLSNSSIYWVAQRTRIPFSRPRVENGTLGNECLPSTDDFPPIFDEGQLRSGAVVVCFLIGIYCFTLLAVVCDSYFLPCVERICEALNLSQVSLYSVYLYFTVTIMVLMKCNDTFSGIPSLVLSFRSLC